MTTSERKGRKVSTFATPTRARSVSFGNDMLVVDLVDGRQISVPIAWFPRLAEARAAHPQELSNWRLIGGGIGLHWPDLDEHVSVENLLANRDEILTYQDRGTDGSPHQDQRQRRAYGRPQSAYIRRDKSGRFIRVELSGGGRPPPPSTTPPPTTS